ncbi:MAG TPA: DUF4159 domain-containing protein [Phycisphaerae bacterium]|nr:DUF4159 domain-containing protein [Phycisphaerae bacterium]
MFKHTCIQLLVGVFILTGLSISSLAEADEPQVSSQQVIASIEKGVKFLLSQEKPDTFWEEPDSQPFPTTEQYGGETALVTEALIYVDRTLHLPELYQFDPPMRNAIGFLLKTRTPTTYYASFTANALTQLPRRPENLTALTWAASYFQKSIHPDGGYTYAGGTPDLTDEFPVQAGNWDNSNSQYGVLGMWACADAGFNASLDFWQMVSQHWRGAQNIDGTWSYSPDLPNGPSNTVDEETYSMTPAGVASLLIADEFLNVTDTGIEPPVDENVVAGLRWMNEHFDPAENNQYVMYGFERVGLASGLTSFGGHNWYQDYAATLIKAQNADGSWDANFFIGDDADSNIGTAYALLILDRGLNPVFMNKLQYTPDYYGQWNARPQDAANITDWVATNTGSALNWQAVNFNEPVSDWMDSPILLITGHADPHFSPAQVDMLRNYVNAGGLVLCLCDGGFVGFQNAMAEYGSQVVNNRYPVHVISPSSSLFTIQPWYQLQSPRVLGISNGVRYLWLIVPEDMGSVWQRREFDEKNFWILPENLYLYATGNGYLQDRLVTLAVAAPTTPPTKSLTMGRLQYDGNWDPEPGAWPRMAALAAADFSTELGLESITPQQANASKIPLIHMTGTGSFSFSDEQIASLRSYLDSGGMLFADAAGGSPSFNESFLLLAQKLAPGAALDSLPDNCPLYTGDFPGGVNASTVTYRKFYVVHNGPQKTPALLGIQIKGRWAIVFSPYDITSGLLGTRTWGISGYGPESAQDLARNIILYAIANETK